MKNKALLAVAAAGLLVTGVIAQTLDIKIGNVTYKTNAEEAGVMTFTDGETLTVQQSEFQLSEIDLITVDEGDFEDNLVTVEYDGEVANVAVANNIKDLVEVEVDGADVSIVQSKDVNDDTGEITYRLFGSSDAGSFTLDGSYKCSVELTGLSLKNPKGAALDLENNKRVAIRVAEDTENFLSDCADGKQKAALYCKGHIEFKQKGHLTVEGNTGHAISAKEYIELKNTQIDITKAVKDGINANQYFLMESGTLNISGVGDDGIQVAYKDDANRDEEDTGCANIEGGKLNIKVTNDASKGIKADNSIFVKGKETEMTISVSGNTIWDSEKSKTKASSCLSADEVIQIKNGTLNLTATGGGGKGISCDQELIIDGGNITISTTGGVAVYTGGSVNNNYTGNLDRIASDSKSSPKGMKCDGSIVINDGQIFVTSGRSEGIESKGTLTINGGEVKVRAYDDAINSSSHMYIKGGYVEVIATNNDGLDTNGNLYIEGGEILAFGGNSPECGLDAADESGYSVIITGGKVLAVGGGNSAPTANNGTTQAYITANTTVLAGGPVDVSAGGSTLYQFTVPEDYNPSSSGGNRPGGSSGSKAILVSLPDMTEGTTYTIKTGNGSATAQGRLSGGGSGPGGGGGWWGF